MVAEAHSSPRSSCLTWQEIAGKSLFLNYFSCKGCFAPRLQIHRILVFAHKIFAAKNSGSTSTDLAAFRLSTISAADCGVIIRPQVVEYRLVEDREPVDVVIGVRSLVTDWIVTLHATKFYHPHFCHWGKHHFTLLFTTASSALASHFLLGAIFIANITIEFHIPPFISRACHHQ